jgi:hypothetical protein
MIMADPKYIAALILGVGVFIALPAVNAAKPPKPVDELEGRVTELEGDVAVLDSEVSGLSGQVNENTADIDDLKSQPPVSAPHLVVVDSTGQQIAIVQQVGEGFSTAAYAVAWFEIAGRYVPLVVYPNLIKYGPFIKILFPGGSNCTGTPYVLETDPDSWLIPTWRDIRSLTGWCTRRKPRRFVLTAAQSKLCHTAQEGRPYAWWEVGLTFIPCYPSASYRHRHHRTASRCGEYATDYAGAIRSLK